MHGMNGDLEIMANGMSKARIWGASMWQEFGSEEEAKSYLIGMGCEIINGVPVSPVEEAVPANEEDDITELIDDE